jgi:segregation and condensation protein B
VTSTGSDAGAGERPADGSPRLRSILESLLFSAGDPLAITRIAQVLPGYDRREIVRTLEELAREYERDERGFRLHEVAGGWQLRTASAHADFVKTLHQLRPLRLTRAALETLAIVAYRQPVTRAEIEAIRGVDADAVLATLLERRLLRVTERKEAVGRPLLYGTTAEFLELFGLKDLSSLPPLGEVGAPVERLERALASLAPEGLDPAVADTGGDVAVEEPVSTRDADASADPSDAS